jgi:hypothetical protein
MSDEILYPLGRAYKLQNGESVEIRPWSIKTMTRVVQRVPRFYEEVMAAKPNMPLLELFPAAIDELKLIASETIGWTPEQIDDRMTADDFLGVVNAIWDECLEGPTGKLRNLVDKAMRRLLMSEPSQER